MSLECIYICSLVSFKKLYSFVTVDDSDITEGNSLLSNLVSNFDLQTISSTVDVDDTILPSQNINVPHEKIRCCIMLLFLEAFYHIRKFSF